MRKLFLLSALCLGITATTHATTFTLVNNAFVDGSTATGSVNIDTTTGTFDSLDVTVLSGGTSYLFSGTPTMQTVFDNGTQYFEYSLDALGNFLVIDVPGASLVGYVGGNLCTVNNLCGSGYAGYFGITTGPSSGNITPLATGSLAVTPEPSSLVLLGTGFLGAVGATRRRLSRTRVETTVSV